MFRKACMKDDDPGDTGKKGPVEGGEQVEHAAEGNTLQQTSGTEVKNYLPRGGTDAFNMHDLEKVTSLINA